MRYHILWIDDRKDWFEPMSESINDYLQQLGLEPTIVLHPDWNAAANHVEEQNIDLIVVDYNLGGIKGDEVVRHIRARDKYIEILFYTADDNYLDVLKPQDGVYRASRNEVDAKIRGLIDLTLKRVQLPAVMRGLVIAETIDLEAQIEDILIAVVP